MNERCTGLKDDNGVNIYESDRLRFALTENNETTEYTAKVVFGNPHGKYTWGWNLVFDEPFSLCPDILLWVETELPNVKCEIIGNA